MADYTSIHTGAQIDTGITKTLRISDGQYEFTSNTVLNDWRIKQEGEQLSFQRFDGGNWVTKGFFKDSIHSDKGVFADMVLDTSDSWPHPSYLTASELFLHLHNEQQPDNTTEPRPYFIDHSGIKYRLLAAQPDGTVRTYDQGNNKFKNLATEDYVDSSIAAIPSTSQVQADWNETDTASKAFIKNKPFIPAPVHQIYISGITPKADKTARVYRSDGSFFDFDASIWFQSTPPHPDGTHTVYYAFTPDNSPSEAEMKSGTKIDNVQHLHDLKVTMTRTNDNSAYLAFWSPDVLGNITYMNSGGFHDVWASSALSIDGVQGKVYVSDNKTHAQTYSFTVGTD